MDIDPLKVLSEDQKKKLADEIYKKIIADIKKHDFGEFLGEYITNVIEDGVLDCINYDAIGKEITKKVVKSLK